MSAYEFVFATLSNDLGACFKAGTSDEGYV